MANKIKTNDTVFILTGRSRGQTGRVIRVLGEDRILVEGVNMMKKHLKQNPQTNERGGIVEREAPIHASNVGLLNPVTRKADRVGFKKLEDGTKVRIYKSTGEVVDV
jgi:large subunit ribosomal protein L24